MGMGRETKKFPYGDSPFPNRVCSNLGTNIYTNHKNLIRDALGLTSDRVYQWKLLLEEYAPEIVYMQGIHNTVADAIS